MLDIGMIGGQCPVQAEGFFDGHPFYFRARGEHWAIEVGEPVHWQYMERYGHSPYAAGWMQESVARAFIEKSYKLYREAWGPHGHRNGEEPMKADALRKVRFSYGLKLAEMAERLSTTPFSLGKYERGEQPVPAHIEIKAKLMAMAKIKEKAQPG